MHGATSVPNQPPASSPLALVTGGTGFVGSHVAEALVAAGWRVRCSTRPTSNTRWLDPLPVQKVEAVLDRDEGWAEAVRGASAVVHVAGVTRARTAEGYRRVNAEGAERVARAALAGGVDRFLLLSSLAARGPDGSGPRDAPHSAYGRSKLEGERRVLAVAGGGTDRMRVTVLRPAGVYGPRDADLLPMFRLASAGWLPVPSGEGRVQPVHARDVASAVVRGLAVEPARPGPFPVAGPEILEWPQLAAAFAEALGRRVRVVHVAPPVFEVAGILSDLVGRLRGRIVPFDRRRAIDMARVSWTCDTSPTREALGWKPEVRLVDGLRETAAWYREHGWLAA